MSEDNDLNSRMFLNIEVTYRQSLYALVIGPFCGRWTLMAVGEVDHWRMSVEYLVLVGGLQNSLLIRVFGQLVGDLHAGPAEALDVQSDHRPQEPGA